MHVTSLETRREGFMLRYYIKILSFEESRNVRFLVDLKAGPKRTKGPGRSHWLKRVRDLISSHDSLRNAFNKIKESLRRNDGVLPKGVDAQYPSESEKYEYKPIEEWGKVVDQWMQNKELEAIRNSAQGSTLGFIARSLAGQTRMPRFPVTLRESAGGNQIRLRLLGGTSALHQVISKYRDRSPECPVCEEDGETGVHFLVQCKGYRAIRETLIQEMDGPCICRPSEQEPDLNSCKDFLESLDDEGKSLFILGGPVEGRCPEHQIDDLCAEFVQAAWKIRSDKLEEAVPDEGPVVDLTNKVRSRDTRNTRRIEQYFHPLQNTHALREKSIAVDKRGEMNTSSSSSVSHIRGSENKDKNDTAITALEVTQNTHTMNPITRYFTPARSPHQHTGNEVVEVTRPADAQCPHSTPTRSHAQNTTIHNSYTDTTHIARRKEWIPCSSMNEECD